MDNLSFRAALLLTALLEWWIIEETMEDPSSKRVFRVIPNISNTINSRLINTKEITQMLDRPCKCNPLQRENRMGKITERLKTTNIILTIEKKTQTLFLYDV